MSFTSVPPCFIWGWEELVYKVEKIGLAFFCLVDQKKIGKNRSRYAITKWTD